MKILKYHELNKNESISGTELIGDVGPGYGKQIIPNTINKNDTKMLMSNINNKFYSIDDYQDLYYQYLSKGHEPLGEFNTRNLDKVIYLLGL